MHNMRGAATHAYVHTHHMWNQHGCCHHQPCSLNTKPLSRAFGLIEWGCRRQ